MKAILLVMSLVTNCFAKEVKGFQDKVSTITQVMVTSVCGDQNEADVLQNVSLQKTAYINQFRGKSEISDFSMTWFDVYPNSKTTCPLGVLPGGSISNIEVTGNCLTIHKDESCKTYIGTVDLALHQTAYLDKSMESRNIDVSGLFEFRECDMTASLHFETPQWLGLGPNISYQVSMSVESNGLAQFQNLCP